MTRNIDGAMPPDADEGFKVYASAGGRSLARTAELLGRPVGTVKAWSHRYRWADRVARQDVSERDARVAQAYADLGRLLPQAVATVGAAIAGNATGDQLRAAVGVLDRFGLSPLARASLDVTSRSDAPAPVTDAELDRLVRAGDVATLLALATGRPLPRRDDDAAGDDDGPPMVA